MMACACGGVVSGTTAGRQVRVWREIGHPRSDGAGAVAAQEGR